MSQQTIQPTKFAGSKIGRRLQMMLLLVGLVPMVILVTTLIVDQFQSEAIIAAMVVQFIGLLVGAKVIAGVSRQSATISQTFQAISKGDFEARAQELTNDELGASAVALNSLCDTTLNMTQSGDEQDQIQLSIENLVAEMKEIAAGDLTITTEVNEDMTGSIASSVNHMTKQLRSIVGQVQSAAQEVGASAASIRESSSKTSQDGELQANRISEASEELLDMTESFQNVAESTKESVQVAIEARQTASNGLQAVADTVDGMQRIRNQVQSTSKRIKRLGESSQEIGEIVQMISDIADRTSILALNASIQASMAGDAGHGFAVVAEEIECLADRSTTATKDISKLIRAIQNETSEVISDMEESTREVVAGSELANQAGETLFEIDSVSNQLVEMIQTSSESALQQADRVSEIANSMTEVSLSTKESADRSREATRSVSRLAAMVSQLRNSVSQFRVSRDEDLVANPWRQLSEVKVRVAGDEGKSPAVAKNDALAKQKFRKGVGTVSLEEDSNQEGPTKQKSRKKPSSNQPSGVAAVNGTVMMDDTSSVRTERSTELSEDDMESDLLNQVREATICLDEVKIQSGADKKMEQDQSKAISARTINLDDA